MCIYELHDDVSIESSNVCIDELYDDVSIESSNVCIDQQYDDVSSESGKANYQGKYVGDAINFLQQEVNMQLVAGTKYLNKNILWVGCFITVNILAAHLF